MIKKAMILAAGFGTRLRPLTLENPKPLLKFGNQTLLSNTIKFLEIFGIKEVVINVHYLKEKLNKYITNNNFNLKIKIVEEKNKILDTGGGVFNAIKYFSNEPFLIINPDTIWSKNYLNVTKKSISIGKHVVIGSGSVVLPGVSIAEGSTVGALSLITKSLGSWGSLLWCTCQKI